VDSSLGATLALLGAVFLWGASFPAMRVVVQAVGPWAVMWIRFAVALIAVAPFLPRLRPAGVSRKDLVIILFMVLFEPCLYFLLESYALKYTTSSQAGVISSSVPLMVGLGAWLALGERLPGRAWFGLVVSMLGVAVLTLGAGPEGEAENPLLGNMLELAAMACAAVYMVLVKKLSARFGSWTLTAMQVLAGIVFFTPGFFHMAELDASVWTTQVVLCLAFLGVFVTLGAFGLYNLGISRIPASRASAFINLIPVVAVAMGWLLLGEGLNFVQIIGGAGVVGGVWLSQRGKPKAAQSPVS
jgi:drug/metabolite transporter (DMT)-like permease